MGEQWWITTGQLGRDGKKVLGPFQSRDLALDVRVYVEAVKKTDQLWVVEEEDRPPRCHGVGQSGRDCQNVTYAADGFCWLHKGQVPS